MAPRVRAAAKERKEARKLPLSFPAASAPLLSQASLGRGRAQTPGHFYFCGEREERTGWGVGRGGKPTSPSQRAAEPRPGCGQEVEEGRKGSRALPIRPRHQGMQLGGRWSEAPWSAVCAVLSQGLASRSTRRAGSSQTKLQSLIWTQKDVHPARESPARKGAPPREGRQGRGLGE